MYDVNDINVYKSDSFSMVNIVYYCVNEHRCRINDVDMDTKNTQMFDNILLLIAAPRLKCIISP